MMQGQKNNLVKLGFTEARALTKKFTKTFYLASHFLSKEKKNACYAVYAICRISDESVDNIDKNRRLGSLNKLKQDINAVYNNGNLNNALLSAFKETVNKYKIPRKYFAELIDGMYMDLDKARYRTFDELYTYCYRVAGVVGLIVLKIFGYNNSEAEKYAIDLGIAMQLTNILRDIKEDCQRSRVYIPQEELEQFNLKENNLYEHIVSREFIDLLKFQIKRAKRYYNNSGPGIKMIADARSRFVVLIMKNMYSEILNSIEKNNCDVFSQRAYVNNLNRFAVILKTLFKG